MIFIPMGNGALGTAPLESLIKMLEGGTGGLEQVVIFGSGAGVVEVKTQSGMVDGTHACLSTHSEMNSFEVVPLKTDPHGQV